MSRKVFLLNGAAASGEQQVVERIFAVGELEISCEAFELTAELSAEGIAGMLADPELHGALLAPQHSQDCRPHCAAVSPAAQLTGTVDVVVRLPDGRVYGDNTLAHALVELLRSEGVGQVRTALVLGAGDLGRAAVAALRDLECARYVVGHRGYQGQDDLAHQFRQSKKQITFFPLDEMAQFFAWAEGAQAFTNAVSAPMPGKKGGKAMADKGEKRWELLVNATPSGGEIFDPGTPVANRKFLGTVNRVLDLISGTDAPVRGNSEEQPSLAGPDQSLNGHPTGDGVRATGPSQLVGLARHLGIPAYTGARLRELQLSHAVSLWLRALRAEALPIAETPRKPHPYVLRRRRKV